MPSYRAELNLVIVSDDEEDADQLACLVAELAVEEFGPHAPKRVRAVLAEASVEAVTEKKRRPEGE